jgi:hypothetical protein
MRRTLIIAAAIVAALLTATGEAQAQVGRTFVSGHGSDSNPCSLAAPCRTFAQALSQTNAGGEITVLDPAGYGPVTINNKSISIVNDGVGEAGVTTNSAVAAITVNISASDVVNLRGLTLVGGGVGTNGVLFNNVGSLNMQNCVVRGFQAGISVAPTGSAALNVSDTVVSNNNITAIGINPSGSGAVTAAFDRVQAIGGSNSGFLLQGGLATGGTLDVTIANSVATNAGTGITVSSTVNAAPTQLMLSNSVVSNNGTGIFENGPFSTTYLAKNTIAGNTTAFTNNGTLFSFGDNYIKTNGNDGGPISVALAK